MLVSSSLLTRLWWFSCREDRIGVFSREADRLATKAINIKLCPGQQGAVWQCSWRRLLMAMLFLLQHLALRWTQSWSLSFLYFCSNICLCHIAEAEPLKKQWPDFREEKRTVFNLCLFSAGASLNSTSLSVRSKKRKESSAVLMYLTCGVKLCLDKAVYTILYKQAGERTSNNWCIGCVWVVIRGFVVSFRLLGAVTIFSQSWRSENQATATG